MKRFSKAVFALVFALVLLEAMLQIGAVLVLWMAPAATKFEDAAVLCIGDSYTFGIGATTSERSYPGVLQSSLRGRGIPVTVANAGYPGQHSGDLLSKLPAQLTSATKVVCVLVGTNDHWRHPDRAPTPTSAVTVAKPTRLRFVWRTGRLLSLLFRFEAHAWEKTGDAGKPLVGSDEEAKAMEIARGHALLAASGRLGSEPKIPSWTPTNPSVDQSRVVESWRLMNVDPPKAIEHVDALLADHPGDPQILCVLAEATARSGRQDRANAAVAELRQLFAGDRSAMVVENLARALLHVGKPSDALALATARVAEEPLAVAAWITIQQAAFSLGLRNESMQAMERTTNLVGVGSPWLTGKIARNYARWLQDEDPSLAARLVTAATLIDGSDGETRIFLMQAGGKVSREHFEAAIRNQDVGEGPSLAKLRAVIEEHYSTKDGARWPQVLGDHLRDIVALARARGAEVVFLSYPFLEAEAEAVAAAVAAETKCKFVPIRERFDAELKSKKREDLFVADGHCNDAGYAIMAEMAADAVVQLLR